MKKDLMDALAAKPSSPRKTEAIQSVKLPDDFASKLDEIMKIRSDLDDLRKNLTQVSLIRWYKKIEKNLETFQTSKQQNLSIGCLEAHLMKLHLLFHKYFQPKSLDEKFINNLKLMHKNIKCIKMLFIKDKASK